LYVSGEENSWQIASRASRLGINDPSLYLLCDTDADSIADIIADGIGDDRRMPSLVVIDSVQTMRAENGGNSSPGGITQVKEVTSLFLRLAKYTQVPIVLIGHVTKAGDIAGPQVISHAVDTVLYLEVRHSPMALIDAPSLSFFIFHFFYSNVTLHITDCRGKFLGTTILSGS